MRRKLVFIFLLIVALFESAIIFNDKSEIKHDEEAVECYNQVQERSSVLQIDEIVKDLEKYNVNLLNITKENG